MFAHRPGATRVAARRYSLSLYSPEQSRRNGRQPGTARPSIGIGRGPEKLVALDDRPSGKRASPENVALNGFRVTQRGTSFGASLAGGTPQQSQKDHNGSRTRFHPSNGSVSHARQMF